MLVSYLSIGFLNKNQMGLMMQFINQPLETMGVFFQHNGGLINNTLILGPSGGTLALRYDFLK